MTSQEERHTFCFFQGVRTSAVKPFAVDIRTGVPYTSRSDHSSAILPTFNIFRESPVGMVSVLAAVSVGQGCLSGRGVCRQGWG